MRPGTAETTRLDPSSAERSARDAWCDSAVTLFCEACALRNTDRARSLERLRLVLEGWGHAVRVTVDPEFKPYERGELRRQQLAPLLDWVSKCLPPALRDSVRAVKTQGDLFHHNQGVVQGAMPRIAHARLLDCAALLEWLYQDLLEQRAPARLSAAIAQLHGRSEAPPVPGERPAPKRGAWSLVPAVVGLAIATSLAVWQHRGTSVREVSATGDSAAPDDTIDALPSGVTTPVPSLSTATPSAGPARDVEGGVGWDERKAAGWIRTYEAALRSRNLDLICPLHAFPVARLFTEQSIGSAELRQKEEAWFREHPDYRWPEPIFQDCKLATPTVVPDSVTVACRRDCLSFTREGKLRARYEIGGKHQPATCPE